MCLLYFSYFFFSVSYFCNVNSLKLPLEKQAVKIRYTIMPTWNFVPFLLYFWNNQYILNKYDANYLRPVI